MGENNKNICFSCNEIVKEDCAEKPCPFTVKDICVEITKRYPCLGLRAGVHKLDDFLTIMEAKCKIANNGTSNNNCDCPPKKYTINSICKPEGDRAGYYILNITPNFTYNYPLTLSITFKSDSDPLLTTYQTGLFQQTIQNTIMSVPFNILFVGGFDNIPIGNLEIQVTDNRGNYSEVFSVNTDDITICT